jgi:Tol biopolymer transport system component
MVMWTIRIDIDDAGAVTYLGTPEAIDLPTDLHLSGGPPAWSPDGRWIAFRGYREVGPSPYENGIYAVPCPGSTYPMSIVHVADPPDSISMGVSVSWDPSSTYVTYNQDGSIVKQQVVQVVGGVPNLIPLDSAYQPAVLVTNVANSYDGPVWSSSSVLAFCHDVTSGKKTVSYLYTVPADTTTIDVSGLSYISGTSGAGHPAWSPGGAFVIYTNGRGIVRLDMATRTQILFGSSNDAWPNWRP